MFAFDLTDRKMVSVALTPLAQQELVALARAKGTSAQFELRKVLEAYQVNGHPPQPTGTTGLPHRFVPVKNDIVAYAESVARDCKNHAVDVDAGDILGAIVEQQLKKQQAAR
jgi:hypothetical protein